MSNSAPRWGQTRLSRPGGAPTAGLLALSGRAMTPAPPKLLAGVWLAAFCAWVLSPPRDVDASAEVGFAPLVTFAAAHPEVALPPGCRDWLSPREASGGMPADQQEMAQRCEALRLQVATSGRRGLGLTRQRGVGQPGWLTAGLQLPGLLAALLAALFAAALLPPLLDALDPRRIGVAAGTGVLAGVVAAYAAAGDPLRPMHLGWLLPTVLAAAFARVFASSRLDVAASGLGGGAALRSWGAPAEAPPTALLVAAFALGLFGVGLDAELLARCCALAAAAGAVYGLLPTAAAAPRDAAEPPLAPPGPGDTDEDPSPAGLVALASPSPPPTDDAIQPTSDAAAGAAPLGAADALAERPGDDDGPELASLLDAAAAAVAKTTSEGAAPAASPAAAALAPAMTKVVRPQRPDAAHTVSQRRKPQPAGPTPLPPAAAGTTPPAAGSTHGEATVAVRRKAGSSPVAAEPRPQPMASAPRTQQTTTVPDTDRHGFALRSAVAAALPLPASTVAYDAEEAAALRAGLAGRARATSAPLVSVDPSTWRSREVHLRERTTTGLLFVRDDGNELTLRDDEVLAVHAGVRDDLGPEPVLDIYVVRPDAVERWCLPWRGIHRQRLFAGATAAPAWAALATEIAGPNALRLPAVTHWPPAVLPRYRDDGAMASAAATEVGAVAADRAEASQAAVAPSEGGAR